MPRLPHPRAGLLRLGVATIGALGAAGCLPERVTIDLKPSDRELAETVVLSDDGRRDSDSASKVALIDVRGMIADGSAPSLLGSGPNPVDELTARLDRAARDPGVRAVVLRINSPGGTVSGSDTMYREIRRFRETTGKPVVACMSELCASGGYYLALSADELIAQPTTITASIGVIIQTFNFSAGMARFGIEGRAVTSGPNKAMGSPFEPAKEEHYAILQGMVNEFYANFRGLVASRRPGVSAEDLARCTDGRVVTGVEAARVGLVDSTGDLHDAFDAAKRRAGLGSARLVKYHAKGNAPRTAYSSVAPLDAGAGPALGDTTNVSLLSVNADSLGLPMTPGFYYLWTPTLP